MIQKLISLYKPSYINVVTYLLQASEYNAKWYLKSYWATDDFEEVAKYMSPDSTKAFRALRAVLWAMLIMLYIVGLVLIFRGYGYTFVGVGVIMATPVVVAQLIVIPLVLANIFIRRPREKKMVQRASEILASSKATKIAVVGSYGKTTMKEILTEILGTKLKVASTPGNYNTPVGISRFADSLEGDEDVLIVELGEYVPGDIEKMSEMVKPDWAIVTGINEQHMQRMVTIENTISAIFEVADYVDKDKLLVNTDSQLVSDNKKPKNVIYNHKRADKWKSKGVELGTQGTKFEVTKGKRKLDLETQLLGAHQIGPLLAGVYLADKLGLKDKDIIKGVKETKPHGRRFNPRELENGAIFIDDTYNGNPDGFAVGIQFLDDLGDERVRVFITAGIIELGQEKIAIHQWIGRQLAESDIERILLIRTPATEWIADGLHETNPDREFEWVEPETKIYDNLDQFVSAGDVALMQNWQREKVFYEL